MVPEIIIAKLTNKPPKKIIPPIIVLFMISSLSAIYIWGNLSLSSPSRLL
jgi:hypothetical protein